MHLLQLHDAGRLVGVVVGAKGTREGGGHRRPWRGGSAWARTQPKACDEGA
jgi:hypothetical protein